MHRIIVALVSSALLSGAASAATPAEMAASLAASVKVASGPAQTFTVLGVTRSCDTEKHDNEMIHCKALILRGQPVIVAVVTSQSAGELLTFAVDESVYYDNGADGTLDNYGTGSETDTPEAEWANRKARFYDLLTGAYDVMKK